MDGLLACILRGVGGRRAGIHMPDAPQGATHHQSHDASSTGGFRDAFPQAPVDARLLDPHIGTDLLAGFLRDFFQYLPSHRAQNRPNATRTLPQKRGSLQRCRDPCRQGRDRPGNRRGRITGLPGQSGPCLCIGCPLLEQGLIVRR